MKQLAALVFTFLLLGSISAFGIVAKSAQTEGCACETSIIEITITNNETSARNYSLSVSGEEAWARIAPKDLSLKANEQGKAFLYLTPECFTSKGNYKFSVFATDGKEKKEAKTTMNVNACVSLKIADKIQACKGETANFSAEIRNDGKISEKEYEMRITGGKSDTLWFPKTVKVKPSASEKIGIIFNSSEESDYNYSLEARAVYAKTNTEIADYAVAKFGIETQDCYGTEISTEGTNATCSEDGTAIEVVIKNNGRGYETYNLSYRSALSGKFEKSMVGIPANSTAIVLFKIDKNTIPGVYNVYFKTEGNGGTKNEIEKKINVEECKGVKLVGGGDDVCPCEKIAFSISAINRGKLNDSYKLELEGPSWMNLSQNSIEVKGYGRGGLYALADSCKIEPGIYTAKVRAISENFATVGDVLDVDVRVRSKQECYGSRIETAAEKLKVDCKLLSVPLKIKNTGIRKNVYSVFAEGKLKWATVSPETLELQPNATGTAYLLISTPVENCENGYGNYTAKVIVESRGIITSREFSVYGSAQIIRNATKKGNATKSIEMNVSYENGNLVISALPKTKINLIGPKNKTYENSTNASGILLLKNAETGTWNLTLSKEGYANLTITYDAEAKTAAGKTAGLEMLPLVLAAFVIVIAAVYYLSKRNRNNGTEQSYEDEIAAETSPKAGEEEKKATGKNTAKGKKR